MDKEKLLYYFEVNTDGRNNKTLLIAYAGLNVFITVFHSLILFPMFHLRTLAFLFLCLAVDLSTMFFQRFVKNHIKRFIYISLSTWILPIKLFGFYVFELKNEYTNARIAKSVIPYLLTMLLFMALCVYIICKVYKRYIFLKSSPLDVAKKEFSRPVSASSGNLVTGLAIVYLISIPLYEHILHLEIESSFYTFSLASLFAVMACIPLPKVIIAFKYKVWRYFNT